MSTDYAPETLRAASNHRMRELRRIRYERSQFRLFLVLVATWIVTCAVCFWRVNS